MKGERNMSWTKEIGYGRRRHGTFNEQRKFQCDWNPEKLEESGPR